MTTSNRYTIEGLKQTQHALRQQTEASKSRIADHWASLFAPPKADTKVQRWVNQAERAVAVYDGFMVAFKLISRLHLANLFLKRAKRTKRKR